MDLYQLRYFLETARELNFSRAAKTLGVSPSAVSRSVALLEASVGKALFTRSKRRVALTGAGESLKARAERVFDELEAARSDLSSGAPSPSALNIGCREMITNYLLPGPLRAFQALHPGTRIGLYELEPAAMADAVKKDRLDFGFHYAELADPALESRFLGKLVSRVYASKDYLKRHGRPRGIRELLEHPFVAPRGFAEDPTAPRADGFPDGRYPRRIRYETDLLETHRRFVLDGLCVGVLPERVMAGGAVALDGPPLHRSIHFFKRRGRALPGAVEALIAAVRMEIRGGKGSSRESAGRL